MENEVIQKQLLARAFVYPYIATDVVSKGITQLFPDSEMYRTFGLIFNRYYQTTQEKMSLETLKMKLEQKTDVLVKANKLTDMEVLNYFKFADELNNLEIDNSTEILDSLNSYVRNALLTQAILKSATEIDKGKMKDVVTPLQSELDNINSLDITGTGSQIVSVYEDTDEKVEIYDELSSSKLASGIHELDMATDGGLARGEVGLIAAASGYGKTTIMSNIAVSYVKRGINVFYVSLEELRSRMLLRFDRLMMQVTVNDIINKQGGLNKDYKFLSDAVYKSIKENQHIGKLAFYKSNPQTITVQHLQQVIQANMRASKTHYDVVVLDYPDLLLNPQETGNEAKDGGRLFEELRKMAQDLDVVLWTATQLNRSSNGQEIKTMASVEGSYRKLNTCEFVCTLNRTEQEYDNGYLRLHIDKNRNKEGFLGDTLYFKYEVGTTLIRDETDAERAKHKTLIDSADDVNKAKRKARYAKQDEDKYEMQKTQAQTINQGFGANMM